MDSSTCVKSLCFLILAGAAFVASAFGATTTNFAGHWALKIGNRTLIALTVEATQGSTARFSGWLALPRHFESGGAGNFFSEINGPVIQYPIVESNVTGNCLAFTTQNPADKNDHDHFRFCVGAPGHGTLDIDIPGFEPLPAIKEKGPIVVATDWDSSRTYYVDETEISNAEMRGIFEADQNDRQPGFAKIDWSVVSKRDAARREMVRQLLSKGILRSGKDFERAAFIFQHGDTPDDYLLAHTLAMVAVARGDGNAIWISAATLDRYLHSIHQPQIYGTQYNSKPDGQMTQEPYNRSLISDALRHDLGVPSRAAQDAQEKQYEKNGKK